VKKNLLCLVALLSFGTAAAMADELSVPPALYLTTPDKFLSWSGFYFGGNGGYGFGSSSVAYTPNDPAARLGTCGHSGGGTCIPSAGFREDGPTAGGQVGLNWQINSMWLTGVEADYQWSDFKGAGSSTFHLGGVGTTSMNAVGTAKSFGTVRLRMGVIPMAPLLFYGTGGVAFAKVSENLSATPAATNLFSSGGFSYSCVSGAPCFAGSSSNTLWGWTLGGGAEYALTNNLTLKSEILYVHFPGVSATAVAQGTTGGTAPASFTAGFSIVGFVVARGGLNFRF
jgi:outer membrane immunogenic protein